MLDPPHDHHSRAVSQVAKQINLCIVGSFHKIAIVVDTGVEENAESSFPITLHPPLPPTLTQHTSSTSPPSSHIPDPALGPILVPAAPPYSQSSGMESEQSNGRQLPVHISSIVFAIINNQNLIFTSSD